MIFQESLPYLTAEFPGVGGRIKSSPADFIVEEIPAYEPSGQGEHLYLWLEKIDMGAEFFQRQISKRLNIPNGDIGIAGLKDRHAVTRQWVSVPHKAEPNLPQLEGDGIRVLNVTRHNNKLRTGHLRGNRFEIIIREANPANDIEPILQRIREQGMPNFYGPQRFGRELETLKLGWDLLTGQPVKMRNPFLKKLALSATQSYLFNQVLAQRMLDGFYRQVLDGDVMAKWPAGGMFTSQDRVTEQTRFDAREIIHAGPMFGKKMFTTTHIAAEREQQALTDAGLTIDSFGNFGQLLQGTRRHNLVYVDDLTASWEADSLNLKFTLPSGCYATVLLGEVMKSSVNMGDAPDVD